MDTKEFRDYVCDSIRNDIAMHTNSISGLEQDSLYDINNYSEFLERCAVAYIEHYDSNFKLENWHEYDVVQTVISSKKFKESVIESMQTRTF